MPSDPLLDVPRPPRAALAVRVLATTLAFLIVGDGSAQSKGLDLSDDVLPTPEQRLAAAGIEATIPMMAKVLLDDRADPELRYFAAVALGRTREKEASAPLLRALEDTHEDIRAGAVIGLGSIADPSSVPAIRAVLSGDADPGVRTAAAVALEYFGTDEAADALLTSALNAEETEHVRINAIAALGHFDLPSVTLKLRPLLDAPEERIRCAAAVLMAAFGDRTAIPTLVDLALSQETEASRGEALMWLERLIGETIGGYVSAETGAPTDVERAAAMAKVSAWWGANRHFYERR